MSAKVAVACTRCDRRFTRYRSHAARAKVHFCSRDCYHAHTSKAPGIKWDRLDGELDRLVGSGAGDREIADRLEVSVDAVKRRRRTRHGRRRVRELHEYSTSALTDALRSKGYSVRLIRIT